MKSVWMRILGVLLIVLGVIFTLITVMLFIGLEDDQKAQSIILLIISAAFWTFGIRLVRKAKKCSEEEFDKKVIKFKVRHEMGLPLAQGSICYITFHPNEIEVMGLKSTFHLELSRVKDIAEKTDTEIREAYVSSAGDAISGAMRFGALGAMLGGQPKRIVSTAIDYYLVIAYQNENLQIVQMAFKVLDIEILRKLKLVRARLAENPPVHVSL